MTEQLEATISKLLVADTSIIQQGTLELREAFKHPQIIPVLCQLGSTSGNSQIRQYAIVLVRNRLKKNKNWVKLKAPLQKSLKDGILEALLNEQEKSVRLSMSQLVGTICRHDGDNWPRLPNFIKDLIGSQQQHQKEIGMHLVSIVSDSAPEMVLKNFGSFRHAFDKALQEPQTDSAYYAAKALINLIPYVGSESVNKIQPLLPAMLNLTKALVVTEEDRAAEVMELWEVLLESELSLIVPHLKPLTEMCLEIIRNKELEESLRNKAIHYIGCLARTKKKSILKLKLLQPILNTLFVCMATEDYPDDQDEDFEQAETLSVMASQALNFLALNMPPDKLMPPLLTLIEASLKSAEPRAKRGAYVALAVVAEGCSEYIRSKHLDTFAQVAAAGIQDTEMAVRNAALFAVGQFSEYLQPDISKFADLLLPVLFAYLTQVTSAPTLNTTNKSWDRLFYALEMFCETMEDKLIPHLPLLMDKVFVALGPDHSMSLKELALSSIGAAANATKEGLVPYFPQIMAMLRSFLVTEKEDEELFKLQVQALDSLAAIARTIGEATFLPIASECISFTLNLMRTRDDPDLRKVSFGLFASVSVVMKESMTPHMTDIVEPMLEALISVEGVTPHTKDEEEGAFPVAEGLDDDESDDDEIDLELINDEDDELDDKDSGIDGFSVENAYLEEKEQALLAVGEVAQNTKTAFFPFMEKTFTEVFKLADYPHEDIRSAALASLSNLVVCLAKSEPIPEEELQRRLTQVVPKLAEIIQTDSEAEVVIAALETFVEILTEAGSAVLKTQGHTEAAFNCIKEVMQKKTVCQQEVGQDESDEEDEEEDEHDSEFEEALIENAGELMPALAGAMSPQDFAPLFKDLLPMFLNLTKKSCTLSEKAFSIGALAETVHAIPTILPTIAETLFTAFTTGARDSEADVRNNAIYGLGELVYYTKDLLVSQYPSILSLLGDALRHETHPRTTDNICGAIARIIEANLTAVPIEQVFPVLLKSLPLREDSIENMSVFRCFQVLYNAGHPQVKEHLSTILEVAVKTLVDMKLEKEPKDAIRQFMHGIEKDFPTEFAGFMSNVPAEALQKIHVVLSE